MQSEFENNKFTIKLTPHLFRGLWTDMGVEMSAIRDSKGESGIIGLTRKDSAVLQWTLTGHIIGVYAKNMRDCINRDTFESDKMENYVHEQEGTTILQRNKTNVQYQIY